MKALIICGPTGSGKSALALDLAKEFNGVIINADSIQVYRELKILSARPAEKEIQQVPHRLFGIMSMHAACSVGIWREMAIASIADCERSGRLPILCGGTGMYVRYLLGELSNIPKIPALIRNSTHNKLKRIGNVEFKRLLVDRDPVSQKNIATGDTQRLLRAWEVLEFTGKPISVWHKEQGNTELENDFYSVLLMPSREKLYSSCDNRFVEFIRRGAVSEVEQIKDLNLKSGLPAIKALGLTELSQYLDGEIGLDTAIELAQRETRRYAKRQMTWFRNQLKEDYLVETNEDLNIKSKLKFNILNFLE